MGVLITANGFSATSPECIERIRAAGHECTILEQATKEQFESELIKCRGVILGMEKISDELMEKCSRLKVISRRGVGVENIDTEAAARRNIAVEVTADANADAVAELIVCDMLMLFRRALDFNLAMRTGIWERVQANSLSGKTIGIVGMGAVGRRLSMLLAPFNVRILYYSRNRKIEAESSLRLEYVLFEELLSCSDAVVATLALNEDTAGIFDREAFAHMKHSAFFINTSRGGLAVQSDLWQALRDKVIAGAALDVFENEPEDGSVFGGMNVLLTPHIGGFTRETQKLVNRAATDNLLLCL